MFQSLKTLIYSQTVVVTEHGFGPLQILQMKLWKQKRWLLDLLMLKVSFAQRMDWFYNMKLNFQVPSVLLLILLKTIINEYHVFFFLRKIWFIDSHILLPFLSCYSSFSLNSPSGRCQYCMREVVKKTRIFCVPLNLKPFPGGFREGVMQMRNHLFMVWKCAAWRPQP